MRTTHEERFNTSRGCFIFYVSQLGGLAAGKTLVRIAPLIPQLVKVFAGVELKSLTGGAEALKKFDLNKLDLGALGSAIASLPPDEFERLAVELLAGSFGVGTDSTSGEDVRIDLTKNMIDQLFVGQVWELFKLIGFAIKVNYLGFSLALPATAQRQG